jgi:PAS domain S-box-containing protein
MWLFFPAGWPLTDARPVSLHGVWGEVPVLTLRMPEKRVGQRRLARLAEVLVDASPDALLAISPAAEVLFWNEGAELTFGYTRGEAVGRSLCDLIAPPGEVDEVRRVIAGEIEQGAGVYEATRRTKQGRLILVDVSARVVRDADGGVELIVYSAKDVTALRSLHEATRLQAHVRGLLEFVPDAIVVMNAHGRIVLVNAQTERLFGYRRDELHGKTIEVLVPRRFPDVRVHRRFRSFNDPRQRAMGADLELYGLRKDGQEFPP